MRLLTAECCAQRMALPASEPWRMWRQAGAIASGSSAPGVPADTAVINTCRAHLLPWPGERLTC